MNVRWTFRPRGAYPKGILPSEHVSVHLVCSGTYQLKSSRTANMSPQARRLCSRRKRLLFREKTFLFRILHLIGGTKAPPYRTGRRGADPYRLYLNYSLFIIHYSFTRQRILPSYKRHKNFPPFFSKMTLYKYTRRVYNYIGAKFYKNLKLEGKHK